MGPLRPPCTLTGRSGPPPENTFASSITASCLAATVSSSTCTCAGRCCVVHHDSTLERTTSGPQNIGADCRELAQVDAATVQSWSEPAQSFPFRGQGHGVPRLGKVLARYPGIPLIIELKANDPELARRAVEEVRTARAMDHVAFGSFGWRVLRAARRFEPRIPTGASREEVRLALYRSWLRWPIGSTSYRELQVPERSGPTRIVSRRFVDHAHRAGLPVKVWTVNDPHDMRRLLEWGVDALISDRPDLAVAAVRGRTGG